MATLVSASSGNNSATFSAAADAVLDSNEWGTLDASANARIKALLDSNYVDQPAFAAAAAAAGLSTTVFSAGAAAPTANWTCGAGAKPVLTLSAALTGHVRISLSYSASA